MKNVMSNSYASRRPGFGYRPSDFNSCFSFILMIIYIYFISIFCIYINCVFHFIECFYWFIGLAGQENTDSVYDSTWGGGVQPELVMISALAVASHGQITFYSDYHCVRKYVRSTRSVSDVVGKLKIIMVYLTQERTKPTILFISDRTAVRSGAKIDLLTLWLNVFSSYWQRQIYWKASSN